MSGSLERRLQKLERRPGARAGDAPGSVFAVGPDGTIFAQIAGQDGPSWQPWRKPAVPDSLVRSLHPVLPGETLSDWNAHLTGMVEDLDPVGAVEVELAGRVALLSWRLRRVAVYEVANVAEQIDKATAWARGERNGDPSGGTLRERTVERVRWELEAARVNARDSEQLRGQYRQLAALPGDHRFTGEDAFSLVLNTNDPTDSDSYVDVKDHAFLADIGVPAEWRNAPWSWDGWTAGLVRQGIEIIAREFDLTAAVLIEKAIRDADKWVSEESADILRLEVELAGIEGQLAREQRARAKAILPWHDAMEEVMRYENHLTRQLAQTLNLLERHRSTRAGKLQARLDSLGD
jgi:hypothetical protein